MGKKRARIDRLLEIFPLYSEELGIDLSKPSGRFKWFVASILFGARISEQIASNTYGYFETAGIASAPEKIIQPGLERLVEILDSGGYVRYDFSTATKLLEIMASLQSNYGNLENLYRQSTDSKDLERRLQEFKGIGPATTQIFLRELRGRWNVEPEISKIAGTSATNLEIELSQFEGERLARVETALVKLYLRYCKKSKCSECPMKESCTK